MGLFSFLFKKKKTTLEEANAINQDFIEENPVPTDDENALMRQASSMMTSGKFAESTELYKKLAEDYPSNKGMYLSQVGVGYYFTNDFDQAIEYYLKAKDEGADSGMMDDNIWEACEAIYERDNDKKALEKYLEHFPNGSYAKKAKKKLSK